MRAHPGAHGNRPPLRFPPLPRRAATGQPQRCRDAAELLAPRIKAAQHACTPADCPNRRAPVQLNHVSLRKGSEQSYTSVQVIDTPSQRHKLHLDALQ